MNTFHQKRLSTRDRDDRFRTTYNSDFGSSTYQTKYTSDFGKTSLRQSTHGNDSHKEYSTVNSEDYFHPPPASPLDENHVEPRAFLPTNKSWQTEKAGKLGLQVVKYNTYGSQKTYNDKSPPKDTISVRGDGNCFFRAVCVIITGVEDEHLKVREAVTKHVSDHPDMYRSFLQSRGGMTEYLTNMRRSREWATDVELLATATLLRTIIEVYFPYPISKSETEYRWQTFKPLNLPEITFPVIYLSNKYDHFDPVLDIESPKYGEVDRCSMSHNRQNQKYEPAKIDDRSRSNQKHDYLKLDDRDPPGYESSKIDTHDIQNRAYASGLDHRLDTGVKVNSRVSHEVKRKNSHHGAIMF